MKTSSNPSRRPALKIFQNLPRTDGQNLLFTTNGQTPVSGFSKVKKRLDGISGVTNWRFHDLRRSFATHSTEKLSISSVIIDKILNHVTGQVRGVAATINVGVPQENGFITGGPTLENIVADGE